MNAPALPPCYYPAMPTVTIDLAAFVQTKQVVAGPSGDEMHGRVLFDVTVDGKPTRNCRVDVKLVVGGTYDVDAIEVAKPDGYRGPFNQQAFAKCVEAYVRGAVGRNGWAIRLGPGSSNIVMINNLMARHQTCSFDATGDSGGW